MNSARRLPVCADVAPIQTRATLPQSRENSGERIPSPVSTSWFAVSPRARRAANSVPQIQANNPRSTAAKAAVQARQGELNATQIPAREREQRQRDRGVASEPAVALPPDRDTGW